VFAFRHSGDGLHDVTPFIFGPLAPLRIVLAPRIDVEHDATVGGHDP